MTASQASVSEAAPDSDWYSELQGMFHDLRDETILWMLPGLMAVGLILLANGGDISDPARALVPSLAVFLLTASIWTLRQRNYPVAAWIMVVGCLAINLTVATWAGFEAAVFLLALPVGLAMLAISRLAGAGIALACSVCLLVAPPAFLAHLPAARPIVLIEIWGTVGLMWLTLRPLLTIGWWAWSGYRRSTTLLDQSRDTQLQLSEALEDLSAANKQLARLNQQAVSLREIAENERRVKEQFVANISHELRTPLHMIIGFCEMITQAPETYGWGIPETLLADLAVVLRNSRHLSSLIDDVLDLSQIDAGQMALSREHVPLAEIVEAATTAVRPLFDGKGLALAIEVPPDLPPIYCDQTRIREVVVNLLSNAGRFTEQGEVRVRVWRDKDDVVVSVADTGPGISEEDQTRLFKPFQQLDGTFRRRYGGTGLGLTISKNFVELHDGKMWVESQLGHGTTFFFRLPIDAPPPPKNDPLRWFSPYQTFVERHRPLRLRPAPINPRLLVVETGNSMQHLLGRYLDGVEVASVPDLEQAAGDLAQLPAQALLVNTPHIGDMLEQVSSAAALPQDIPVIICSIPGPKQAASALGAVDYLLKPVSRETLLQALDRLGKPVRRVLIADDEPDAVQMLERMLLSGGRKYQVLKAFDGRQALETMRRRRPDVVLLDLTMPAMDGFHFLAVCRQDPQLHNIPVILVTARDPQGQPVLSNALAVTCARGLSVHQILDSIKALNAILAVAKPSADPRPTEAPPG